MITRVMNFESAKMPLISADLIVTPSIFWFVEVLFSGFGSFDKLNAIFLL